MPDNIKPIAIFWRNLPTANFPPKRVTPAAVKEPPIPYSPRPPKINAPGPAPSIAGTMCIYSGGFAFNKSYGLLYSLSGFLRSMK